MPIKILQFTNLINRYDFVDNVIQLADPKRFEVGVCVCTADSPIEVPVYRDEMFQRVLNIELTRPAVLQITWQLIKILDEWKPDILHAHNYDEAFIGFLAIKKYPKIKLIVGRHYSDFIYRLPQGIKTRILLKIEGLSNNIAKKIVVPTQSVAEILVKKQNVRPDKVKVIPYGFNDKKFELPSNKEIEKVRKELGFEGKFVVGNFSKLVAEKGITYLIQAAAKLKSEIPNLLIVIAGEGQDQKLFEKQVEDFGLEQTVKFIGFRRDAMIVMRAVDIVAQTSLQESFGQVIVEAMWMKKPIITTGVGIASDIIKTDENGILVPGSDADSIAAAIKKLANNYSLCQEMSERGQVFVKNNLTIEKVIKIYEDMYEQVGQA